jgi:peptidylprolyl isomerase
MSKCAAAIRSFLTGAAALSLGIAIGLFGCDRSGEQPMMAPRDPNTPPPSTQDMTMPQEEARRDVERIPELGMGKAVKIGDEVWMQYPNGMKIYDIRPGSGLHAQPGMTMHVYYKGTFPDGRVFDQSLDKPFEFVLGTHGIIEGWNLAVSTMVQGGKRKVFIPSALAYGTHGALPKIYPNQDLIFEIELLQVTGKAVDFPETKPADTQALLSPTMGPSTGPATKPK